MSATPDETAPEELRRRTGEVAQNMMDLIDDEFVLQMDNDFGPAIQDMDDFLKKRGVKRPMRRQLMVGWTLALVDAR